jgi:hypothetical protein
LRSNLYDPISSAYVVQQKVTEGMDDLIPQSRWNDKHAAVYDCPGRRRGNALDVTDTTTDLRKERLTSEGGGGRSKRRVSRRNHRAAYELSKVVDVGQAKVVWLIVNARSGQKHLSNFGRA